MKKIILAFLITGFSATANALSGSELLAECKKFLQILEGSQSNMQDTFQAGVCGGYVLGVQEGFIASSELADVVSKDQGTAKVTKNYWDIPSAVEQEEVVKIIVKYLEINTNMHDKPAVLSVLNAIRQTFPSKP